MVIVFENDIFWYYSIVKKFIVLTPLSLFGLPCITSNIVATLTLEVFVKVHAKNEAWKSHFMLVGV